MPHRIIQSHEDRSRSGENSAIRRAFARGELVRLQRGVYYPLDAWMSCTVWDRYRVFAEAVARAAPGVVFGVETAAFLHGLPLVSVPRDVVVAVPRRGLARWTAPRVLLPDASAEAFEGLPPRGFGIKRRVLGGDGGATVGGVAVTDLARTVVDCAAGLPFPDGVAIVDGALRGGAGPLSRDGVVAAIAALPRPDRRDRALTVLAFGDSRSESPGESLSRAVIHLSGFEAPLLQRVIADAEGPFARADFYWPDPGVVGEFDGRGKYRRAAAETGRDIGEVVLAEKDRENRIRRTGATVVRWDWWDATTPGRLDRLLSEAGVPRIPRGSVGRGRRQPGRCA